VPVAPTIDGALRREAVDFDVLPRTSLTLLSETPLPPPGPVPARRLARSILLRDPFGHVLVVLPADRRCAVDSLSRALHRRLRVATAAEIADVFYDCDPAALPPLGEEYRVPTLVDRSLLEQDEVWFEAGDRRELVRVGRAAFRRLMADAECVAQAGAPADPDPGDTSRRPAPGG
jgi:Ala-tRNA(Pro) deacylase